MPYRELMLAPALPRSSVLPGDVFPIDFSNSQVMWIRGAAVLRTFAVTLPGANLGNTPPVPPNSPNVSIVYFQEVRMPGQNVSCTRVVENQTTGAVTFNFSSGNNIEYPDWSAVGQVADSFDAVPDIAEKLLVAKAFRASPDGANKTTQVGASVSVNGLADTPVVYTEPQ